MTDPTRMCELLVGLPAVTVLGPDDEVGAPLSTHVETRARRPKCSECGVLARVKDRPVVTLVDLAALGRPTRLVWHKFRSRPVRAAAGPRTSRVSQPND